MVLPEKEHQAAAAGRGHVHEVTLEVADDRMDLQRRVLGQQALGRGGPVVWSTSTGV